MAEQPVRQIRSYHRAFHFELELYTLGNIRLWRPVPARGLFYLAGTALTMLVLAHAPLGFLFVRQAHRIHEGFARDIEEMSWRPGHTRRRQSGPKLLLDFLANCVQKAWHGVPQP